MRNTTLSVLVATSALALAGIAQADTFDSPTQAGEASTMTQGAPNAATTNSPYADGYNPTMVMGAGPAYGYTYSYTYPPVVSYYPSSVYYVTPAPAVSSDWNGYLNGATETSNVPQRAGEASTMSGGVPNAVTSNY